MKTEITFIVAYSLPLLYMLSILVRYALKTKATFDDILEIKKRIIALEKDKQHRWDGGGVPF